MAHRSWVGSVFLAAGRMLIRLHTSLGGVADRLVAAAERLGHPGATAWRKFTQAVVLSRAGDDQAALAHLKAASTALPDEADIAIALAFAFANADEWQRAIEAGERALKFFEQASAEQQLWEMLAWGYLITGRYAQARDVLQRVREVGVSPVPLHLPLLIAHAVLFDQDVPIAEMRALLSRYPRQAQAYWRVIEHLATGRHSELAVRLLSLLPTTAAIGAALTIARRAAQRSDSEGILWAANALRRLELAPQVALATAALAALVVGNDEEALRYCAEATALGPDVPIVHERQALVFFLTGDEPSARTAASAALLAGSRDALCAALVAAALAAEGKVREALGVFREQRLGDALGVLLGHIAQARLRAETGDLAEARRLMALALQESQNLPPWQRRAAVTHWSA
ncbi:MAG: hypothetical protein N2512_15350, partial [Armatimonadetes bacterium]|nr:hypothetical protein [Armatimonadota bacterium]